MNDFSNKAEHKMLDDQAITALVVEVWSGVMDTGNKVISHFEDHGFELMSVVPDPNIHALLIQVRKLEEKMDKILASEHLEYNESRMVLNAKQQVLWMEALAAALTADAREDFDQIMAKIRNQAQI